MTEVQEIVPGKYGNPGDTEWTYGLHYRLRIAVPIETTVLRRTVGNDYLPAADSAPTRSNSETALRRARLEDLFPFIDKAMANGHDFEVDMMDDGRSDPRGYSKLSRDEFMMLIRHIGKGMTSAA